MSAQINTDFETGGLNPVGMPSNAALDKEKEALGHTAPMVALVEDDSEVDGLGRIPTAEELRTLKRVPAKMPWAAILMCVVELAERASYYGSTGVFSNFIQRPLPAGGNGAGAVAKGAAGLNESSGALNQGLRTATALTTLFTFLAYCIPILGGIVADTKWGRFKTICVGVAVGLIAHILLVIPAIPSVISAHDGKGALAAFIISILILAFAAGFIKPSLGPLLCDQSPVKRAYVTRMKDGSEAIVDPEVTVQRYLMTFYMCINIGAFFSLATTYAEHDVGYWLAFLLPGIFYLLIIPALFLAYKHLYLAPMSGSVVSEAFTVFGVILSDGGWKKLFTRTKSADGMSVWDTAKPSVMEASGTMTEKRAAKLDKARFWDDEFVDELKRSISACQIFLFIPIFALCDGGFGSVQNSQAASLVTNGVPNDLISNFNALTIIVASPILNFGLYPFLRRFGINLSPVRRLSIGFFLAGLAMAVGAIIQWKVYETSPCGYYATTCVDANGVTLVSTISLWTQIPLYALPAIGELFVNVTSYEIAYTRKVASFKSRPFVVVTNTFSWFVSNRAPARMKGLVYAMVLFSSALSSALVEILDASPVLEDPHLIWPFVAGAVLCILCIFCMEIFFRDLNTFVIQNPDRMETEKEKLIKEEA